jgi:hypothetical protein
MCPLPLLVLLGISLRLNKSRALWVKEQEEEEEEGAAGLAWLPTV